MNILVTHPKGEVRDTFFSKEVIEKLNSMRNIVWNDKTRNFTKEELAEKLRDIDVCITGWGCPQFDSFVLEKADKFKLLAHTGGSVANVASEALYDKGVKVISGNDIYAESVAEGVITYILCSLREIPYYSSKMKRGEWRDNNFKNQGLLDKTVGLIGFGAVSRHLVKLLSPFRCFIKVYDPFISSEIIKGYGAKSCTLEEVLKESDIISLHIPQTQNTYHMFNEKLLSMIGDDTLLINTARGSIIDEEALICQLKKGRFKAVLDVYEIEPLPQDSELKNLENVILIPHMAGPTADRRSYVTLKILEDIERFVHGKSLLMEIPKKYGLSMTKE